MPKPSRRRVDVLLVERGLAGSRTKAQALVLAGDVSCAGTRIEKPGQLVAPDAELAVRPARRWVGRGAAKIASALDAFGLDPAGLGLLDVGASTGGFTELLLERGARRVIALDVGRNQLDWSLRSDPRVHVMDGVNARYLTRGELPFRPDWAVVDVSFISLEKVLRPVASCLVPGGSIVALVKPQFEVGKDQVGRKGVVADPALHRMVLRRIVDFVHHQGWAVAGVAAAGLRGAEGNQEYFVHIATAPAEADETQADRLLERAVESAGGDP